MDIDMTDTGYDGFFVDIDGIVMGRNTYNFIFTYRSWPYGDKPTWICTCKKLKTLVGANLKVVETIDDFIIEAESKKLKHIWLCGGSILASSF